MLDFFESTTGMLILLIVPVIITAYAQFSVSSTFKKYSRLQNSRGLTGAQTAKLIMQINDIRDVQIESVGGSLTDHYDPTHKKLRLSQSVYGEQSVAALGVAAHEMGHAIQHKIGYGPLVLRSTLVPMANIGSRIGPYLVIIGAAVSSFSVLKAIGAILFSCAVLFYLVTLPVEFDASRRALKNLEENNILSSKELQGAGKVLRAAAMTYVASALTAVFFLIRLILMTRRRDNK